MVVVGIVALWWGVGFLCSKKYTEYVEGRFPFINKGTPECIDLDSSFEENPGDCSAATRWHLQATPQSHIQIQTLTVHQMNNGTQLQ